MGKCKDSRCLYQETGSPLESQFETVTKKTREGEGLWEKCKNCDLVINRSGVHPNEVDDYYNSTYVETNSYTQGELLSAKEHFEARLTSVKNIANYILPRMKEDSDVFELGGATGELLYLLKEKSKSLYNNELNRLYTQFSIQELGMEGSSEDYFKLDLDERFDLILSINTIDHMYETGKAVEKIFRDLRPGGLAYIEVPNDEQALKTLLPEPSRSQFQEFMYQKAHYYSFTFSTLGRLLEESGFDILDSYSRHDYSLTNFLKWYYTGSRQNDLKLAKGTAGLFDGDDPFQKEMNVMMASMDTKFKEIMAKNKRGELLCFLCKKPS